MRAHHGKAPLLPLRFGSVRASHYGVHDPTQGQFSIYHIITMDWVSVKIFGSNEMDPPLCGSTSPKVTNISWSGQPPRRAMWPTVSRVSMTGSSGLLGTSLGRSWKARKLPISAGRL